MSKLEPTDLMMEIGAKMYPRRYRRFRDLRPYQDACEWARNLDWRQNPYDRFLLRRELLHHLESTEFYEGCWNIFTIASREEIAAEVDGLLDEFHFDKYEGIGVFSYVLVLISWRLGFKHGLMNHTLLTRVLATIPSNEGDE